jgi:anhydro-N-acetylmuramic acid kinase
MKRYTAIGLMSGTSLDGLDIAACNFIIDKGHVEFTFLAGETIPYSEGLKHKLENAHLLNAYEFSLLNTEFGEFSGECAARFASAFNFKFDFIASHGHTVFHQPDKSLTVQIGSGAAICAASGLPVVCDFRSLDVALKGQGAPLVPGGEKYLFKDFGLLLNIGGFANITINSENPAAFDVCPANIVLNQLAKLINPQYNYDLNGENAEKGNLSAELLEKLNQLEYYHLPIPKSLGREWAEEHVFPLFKEQDLSPNDLLRTYCEHIAFQTAKAVNNQSSSKMLITGGGAHNKFLIERIKSLCSKEIVVPDKSIVDYKEAVIFAFLGVLRMEKMSNSFKSVTGATKDSIGGAVYIY